MICTEFISGFNVFFIRCSLTLTEADILPKQLLGSQLRNYSAVESEFSLLTTTGHYLWSLKSKSESYSFLK
jgi:hypothetical protein